MSVDKGAISSHAHGLLLSMSARSIQPDERLSRSESKLKKRLLCLLCWSFVIALSAPATAGKPLSHAADITLAPLSEAEITAVREAHPTQQISALGRSVVLPVSAWEHFVTGSPPREGWRVVLRSVGAASMGLMLTGVELAPGVILKTYAPDNPGLLEQWHNNGRDKRFASRMFAGEYLVLELLWPPAVPAVSAAELPFKAVKLSHGLGPADSTGASVEQSLASTDRLVDLCSREEYYARYSTPSRSAVFLRGILATSGNRYNCSATLIDNGNLAAGNRANYLLTAWHCLRYTLMQPQRGDLIFATVVWNYLDRALPHCSTAPPMQEQSNFRLIAWGESFDTALVRLESPPPATARAEFASFSKRVPAAGTRGIFSLAHPDSQTQQLNEVSLTLWRNIETIFYIDEESLFLLDICVGELLCTSLGAQNTLGMTTGGASGGGYYLPAVGSEPPELIGVLSAGGLSTIALGSLGGAIMAIAGLELALLHGEDYYSECIVSIPAPWCDELDQQSLCAILDMSSQDCAVIQDFDLSPSFAVWVPSTETASAMGHSLVTRGVTAYRSGCLDMNMALPAPSQINFRWRVSSEQDYDYLRFSIDGMERRSISGESGWVEISEVTAATTMDVSLSWCYDKDAATAAGSDRGWLDQLSFSSIIGIVQQSTETTQVEGGDSRHFRIELPVIMMNPIRISLVIIPTGTGSFGRDYFLEESNGLSISQTAAGHILLNLEPAVSDFILTIRPRADNILSEGDQNLRLDFIRLHAETAVSSTNYTLSASLKWLLEDDDFPGISGLSLGRRHGCLSVTGGGIRCWGDNTDGQLDLPTPVLYTEVSVGAAHSCFLRGGSAVCSGSDRQTTLFEFSDPQTRMQVDNFYLTLIPVYQTSLPSPPPQLRTITSGAWHNCAITIDNRQLCWNRFYVEYRSSETLLEVPRPLVSVPASASPSADPGPVLQIDAGGFHSCAVLTDQSLSCWGNDYLQQAGSFAEAVNSTGRKFIEVATGVYHSCALTTSGTVFCGGVTYRNSTATALAAVVPANLPPVQSLALGFGHSCALLVDGAVRCWGSNNHGQSSPPADIGTATAIAAGHQFSCAVVAGSADVRCWGRNNFAQLEVGSVLFESRLSLVPRGEKILLPGQSRLLEVSLTRPLSRTLAVDLGFSSNMDESGYRILSADDMRPIQAVADEPLMLTIPAGQTTAGFVISAAAQPLGTTSLTVSIVSSSLNLPWDLNQSRISLTLRRVIATVTVTAAAAEYLVENFNEYLPVPVTVRLFYEGGTPVPGVALSLTAVSSAPGAAVSTSTGLLTDAEGQTLGTVSVLLGSVAATTLTIGVEGLPTNVVDSPALVIHVAAVPILSTVTVIAARSAYLAAPPAEIAVIELEIHLDYLGVTAPVEILTLRAETPATDVVVSPERMLRFTDGIAVATTVTVALNGAGEVLIEFGIAGADTAKVVTATVRVAVIEELVALEIIAPVEVAQQFANAVLQFEVQVRAMGSSGGSFNPDDLVLVARSLSNATDRTYALNFRAGTATAQVTVGLSEQGSHGELVLEVISDSIQTQQRLRLLALPILSTITVVALDDFWYALAPSELVPVALEIRLQWRGTARAERTLLMLVGTASDPAVDITGTGTVEIYAAGSTRVVVSVTPAESLESRLEFTVVDPPQGAGVIPASAVLRQLPPLLGQFTLAADSLLLAQQGQGQRLQTTLSVSIETIAAAGDAPLELQIAVRSENEVRLLEPDLTVLPFTVSAVEEPFGYRQLLTVQPAPGVDTTLVVTALLVIDTTGHRIATGEPLLIIARRELTLRVLTVIPFLPLELNRAEGVTIDDLLLGLRILPQLGTTTVSDSVVENLLSGSAGEITLLQLRDDLQILMPGLDVDHNGRVDAMDFRILFRFSAGLRGAALGAEVDQEQLEYLLGLRSLP